MDSQLAALISPAPLVFAAGVAAAQLRPTLTMPSNLARFLSWYLMAAIGLKGGYEIGHSGVHAGIALHVGGAVLLGIGLAFIAFHLLSLLTRLQRIDRAALAAHYGSVSVVTFVAAAAFLTTQDVFYEPHMVAMMAIMEAPAIVVGVWLGRRGAAGHSVLEPVREALTNPSVLILATGLAGGLLLASLQAGDAVTWVREPFLYVLALFLLQMGFQVGARLSDVPKAGPGLLAFAVLMPLTGGLLGTITGMLIGLSTGGTMLLAVLGASASYIAAPAAVRLALPEANPSYYGLLPLAITFPFNIIIGIPLFYTLAGIVA